MFGIEPVGLAGRSGPPGNHRPLQRVLAQPFVKHLHIEIGDPLADGFGGDRRDVIADHRIAVPVRRGSLEPVAAPFDQLGELGNPAPLAVHPDIGLQLVRLPLRIEQHPQRMQVAVGIPGPVVVVERPRVLVHTAVESAVITSVLGLLDHPLAGPVKRRVENPPLPFGSPFDPDASQRLLPDRAALFPDLGERRLPGLGFEVGAGLFHADIGDSDPETHDAPAGRIRKPDPDIPARRGKRVGKHAVPAGPRLSERPVGHGIEVLAGVIARLPARHDPIPVNTRLALRRKPEKHVRRAVSVREVELVEGRAFGRRPRRPDAEILEPDPVRPGMQLFEVVVVPRRGALRIERHIARRGHDRSHRPVPVTGHVEGDAVDPVGKVTVVESRFGHGIDTHHGVRPVHLRHHGRQQRRHAPYVGIDPASHAFVPATGRTKQKRRGRKHVNPVHIFSIFFGRTE